MSDNKKRVEADLQKGDEVTINVPGLGDWPNARIETDVSEGDIIRIGDDVAVLKGKTPGDEITVYSNFRGEIIEVLVDFGQTVSKGDAIYKVDSDD